MLPPAELGCLCQRCAADFLPCRACVFTVTAPASSLLPCRRLHHCMGVLPMLHWPCLVAIALAWTPLHGRHCHRCVGVVTVITLVLCWRLCQLCAGCALVVLPSVPTLCWLSLPQACVVTLIALASSPSQMRNRCCGAGFLATIALALLLTH